MTINTRLDLDEYFIRMAKLASLRGACVRRQVGCILVNSLNHVIATGYNGRARGVDNCLSSPCAGSSALSGMDLEGCEAIHAEQNALLQCKDVEQIAVAYCTTAPCIHCTKLLMNTSCTRIVFQERYPGMEKCEQIWRRSQPMVREWEHYDEQIEIFDKQELCRHEWFESQNFTTKSDDTIILECGRCLLTKEVGI